MQHIVDTCRWVYNKTLEVRRDTWQNELPEFQQVHECLKEISADDDSPLRGPALTAYSHTASFFKFNIIKETGLEMHWHSMVSSKRNWIIQLKGLEDRMSGVITELLLWNLISYLRTNPESGTRWRRIWM